MADVFDLINKPKQLIARKKIMKERINSQTDDDFAGKKRDGA